VAELAERELPIAEVFGAEGAALEAGVHAVDGDASAVALVERFFRSRVGTADDKVNLAAQIVDLARADPSIGRASDLATRAGVSTRSLERLFHRYVGASPKWVIRRFRVHEACERVAAGAPPCWSTLAQELGYFDQAHFIREFRAHVGGTPAQYAEACATARAGRPA
jgi:AraC-like DNA-binding protein